jgi:hypothetical protein
MLINWQLVVDLLSALAWPAVVAFALYLFRRPLIEFLAQIGRRASKLSVYQISVELAILPELSSSWSIGSADVRQLTSSQVFDSPSGELFEELLKPGMVDYAVVNLGSGREWLTSRLFIFAVILGAVTRLRAFVFVENSGGVRRRFLGIAAPSSVQRALATHYPWLEEARLRAATAHYPPTLQDTAGTPRLLSQPSIFTGTQPQYEVTNFVRNFIDFIQRTTLPAAQEAESHLEIGTDPQRWERAHWIDGDRLERDLAGHLEYEWYENSPDEPQRSLAEGVARRNGALVALVDKDRHFVGLVDRHVLLDQMWRQQVSGVSNAVESKTN